MSTQTLHKFIVYAPDATDPDAFQRRLSVRPKHVEKAADLHRDGIIKVGGAMLTPESLTSDEKKMVGSVLIYEASNIEAVRKIVEEDIYYTSGVWDKEKLVILPFVTAHL
ncbi:hypothetical protein WOLCODRAFT_156458 [Wolfiporia cocos MD-104 SS10]|uniref:YCII-related domain-containing protein n=1 Tax=Wolfiporia cocos (strain MD-104) TaxID=742152 RepID=A0A2H3JAH9_WOLCO|nr:hypothetical protein WOLCODRAFT_156458 [Wolfiporia cocos MD-104 SS10]